MYVGNWIKKSDQSDIKVHRKPAFNHRSQENIIDPTHIPAAWKYIKKIGFS